MPNLPANWARRIPYGMKQAILFKAVLTRSQIPEALQLQRGLSDKHPPPSGGGKRRSPTFMDGKRGSGVSTFDVRTVEEAQALTASDPSIQAGRLVAELHPLVWGPRR